MQIKLPHRVTRAQALERVKSAIEEARGKVAGQATLNEERWEGDTLHFDVTVQGQHIAGTFTVADDHFDLDAKLPIMLHVFEGRIKKAIEEQTRAALGQG